MDQGWLVDLGRQIVSRMDILMPLVVAHLLAEFPAQSRSWLKKKKGHRFHPILFLHATIAALLGYLCLGYWSTWWILPFILIGHALVDAIRNRKDDRATPFLLDQALHFAHLLLLVFLLDRVGVSGNAWAPFKAWTIAAVFLLNWYFADSLIGKATVVWRSQFPKRTEEELDQAGLWIGRLERLLTLIFIMGSHLEAVALLLTAKSIFRFSNQDPDNRRKETEYFLVGTLGSLTFAIVTALLAKALIP